MRVRFRHAGRPVLGLIALRAGRALKVAAFSIALRRLPFEPAPVSLTLLDLRRQVARQSEPAAVHVYSVSPLGFDLVCSSEITGND